MIESSQNTWLAFEPKESDEQPFQERVESPAVPFEDDAALQHMKTDLTAREADFASRAAELQRQLVEFKLQELQFEHDRAEWERESCGARGLIAERQSQLDEKLGLLEKLSAELTHQQAQHAQQQLEWNLLREQEKATLVSQYAMNELESQLSEHARELIGRLQAQLDAEEQAFQFRKTSLEEFLGTLQSSLAVAQPAASPDVPEVSAATESLVAAEPLPVIESSTATEITIAESLESAGVEEEAPVPESLSIEHTTSDVAEETAFASDVMAADGTEGEATSALNSDWEPVAETVEPEEVNRPAIAAELEVIDHEEFFQATVEESATCPPCETVPVNLEPTAAICNEPAVVEEIAEQSPVEFTPEPCPLPDFDLIGSMIPTTEEIARESAILPDEEETGKDFAESQDSAAWLGTSWDDSFGAFTPAGADSLLFQQTEDQFFGRDPLQGSSESLARPSESEPSDDRRAPWGTWDFEDSPAMNQTTEDAFPDQVAVNDSLEVQASSIAATEPVASSTGDDIDSPMTAPISETSLVSAESLSEPLSVPSEETVLTDEENAPSTPSIWDEAMADPSSSGSLFRGIDETSSSDATAAPPLENDVPEPQPTSGLPSWWTNSPSEPAEISPEEQSLNALLGGEESSSIEENAIPDAVSDDSNFATDEPDVNEAFLQSSLESIQNESAEEEEDASQSLRAQLASMFNLKAEDLSTRPEVSTAIQEEADPETAMDETVEESSEDDGAPLSLDAISSIMNLAGPKTPEPTPALVPVPTTSSTVAVAPPPISEPEPVQEEETVASYMEKLLARSRGGKPKEEKPAPKPEPVVTRASASPTATTVDQQSTAPAATDRSYLESGPVHKVDKDEVRQKLQSFRELANMNAKKAINTSQWKREKSAIVSRGVLTVTAILVGVGLAVAPHFGANTNPMHGYGLLAAGLALAVDTSRSVIRWRKKCVK